MVPTPFKPFVSFPWVSFGPGASLKEVDLMFDVGGRDFEDLYRELITPFSQFTRTCSRKQFTRNKIKAVKLFRGSYCTSRALSPFSFFFFVSARLLSHLQLCARPPAVCNISLAKNKQILKKKNTNTDTEKKLKHLGDTISSFKGPFLLGPFLSESLFPRPFLRGPQRTPPRAKVTSGCKTSRLNEVIK